MRNRVGGLLLFDRRRLAVFAGIAFVHLVAVQVCMAKQPLFHVELLREIVLPISLQPLVPGDLELSVGGAGLDSGGVGTILSILANIALWWLVALLASLGFRRPAQLAGAHPSGAPDAG